LPNNNKSGYSAILPNFFATKRYLGFKKKCIPSCGAHRILLCCAISPYYFFIVAAFWLPAKLPTAGEFVAPLLPSYLLLQAPLLPASEFASSYRVPQHFSAYGDVPVNLKINYSSCCSSKTD
jgi:hypothetical protein